MTELRDESGHLIDGPRLVSVFCSPDWTESQHLDREIQRVEQQLAGLKRKREKLEPPK